MQPGKPENRLREEVDLASVGADGSKARKSDLKRGLFCALQVNNKPNFSKHDELNTNSTGLRTDAWPFSPKCLT